MASILEMYWKIRERLKYLLAQRKATDLSCRLKTSDESETIMKLKL